MTWCSLCQCVATCLNGISLQTVPHPECLPILALAWVRWIVPQKTQRGSELLREYVDSIYIYIWILRGIMGHSKNQQPIDVLSLLVDSKRGHYSPHLPPLPVGDMARSSMKTGELRVIDLRSLGWAEPGFVFPWYCYNRARRFINCSVRIFGSTVPF